MSARDYAVLYVGGKTTRGGSAGVILGGDAVLETPQHALDGVEHTNLDAYLKATRGGEDTISAHGNAGATETIDPADGNVHTLTLDADCTITLTAPTAGVGSTIEVHATQDGTGGWDFTWPGSVTWIGSSAPSSTAAGSTAIYILETLDGGTSWLGAIVGGAGTPATTVEAETTFGISSAVGTDTEYARQDHTHGSPPNPVTASAISTLGFVGELLISDTPSTPLVFADLIQNEAETDLVYADV